MHFIDLLSLFTFSLFVFFHVFYEYFILIDPESNLLQLMAPRVGDVDLDGFPDLLMPLQEYIFSLYAALQYIPLFFFDRRQFSSYIYRVDGLNFPVRKREKNTWYNLRWFLRQDTPTRRPITPMNRHFNSATRESLLLGDLSVGVCLCVGQH